MPERLLNTGFFKVLYIQKWQQSLYNDLYNEIQKLAEYDKKRVKVNNMGKLLSYDKENDILVIHRGFTSDEKFKGNIDVGDIVLDVSTNGKIRGIEVFNASQFLKPFVEKGNEESILNNLLDA